MPQCAGPVLWRLLYYQKPDDAFAETFLRNAGSTQLALDLLGRKTHVRLKITGMLRLLQLAGPGLARVGATAQVF